MRNFIEIMETMYATTIPTRSVAMFDAVIKSRLPAIFKILTPTITGIARKNENSAATLLEQPSIIAPKIVAPDLDVPGTIDRTWNIPIKRAVLYVIDFISFTVEVLLRFSVIINSIPYIISVEAITYGFSKCSM